MNDFNELIGGEKPTLVDFFATWCGPCKMQGPILEDVKKELGDAVNVVKIDVDRNQELAARYRIQSVPTLIVFLKGEPVWRGAGVHQKVQLVDKMREFLNPKSDM